MEGSLSSTTVPYLPLYRNESSKSEIRNPFKVKQSIFRHQAQGCVDSMPFTPAFVDTGKPKPERYTETLKRQIQNQVVRNYSKSILNSLVKSDKDSFNRRRNARLSHEHKHRNWNFEKIRSVIAEKLLSRVKRPEQTMREAYKVFGVSKGNGITKPMFARALRNIGLELTPSEIKNTFDHLDADGGGFIDFEEMVQQCFAPDYSRKTWISKRCEQISSHKRHYVAPDSPNFPASFAAFRPSTDQQEVWLRRALIARAKRPQDQMRAAFHMFGRPKHGITLPIFLRVLRRLGMSLTVKEAADLMGRYDQDGSGKLDFNEFACGLLGLDYLEKTWNEKRGEEIENASLAKKLHVNVDVVEDHKEKVKQFRRSQRKKAALAEKARELQLREDREAVMRKHRRRAKRAERAQRISGSSIGQTRSGRAGQVYMQDNSLIHEHVHSLLPSSFRKKGQRAMMERPKSALSDYGSKKILGKASKSKCRPKSSSPSQRRLRKALNYSSTHLHERKHSRLNPNRRRRPRTAHSVATLVRKGVPQQVQGGVHDFGFRC